MTQTSCTGCAATPTEPSAISCTPVAFRPSAGRPPAATIVLLGPKLVPRRPQAVGTLARDVDEEVVPRQATTLVAVHARAGRRVCEDSEDVLVRGAVAESQSVAIETMPKEVYPLMWRVPALAVEPRDRVVVNALKIHPRHAALPRGGQREVLPVPSAAVVDQPGPPYSRRSSVAPPSTPRRRRPGAWQCVSRARSHEARRRQPNRRRCIVAAPVRCRRILWPWSAQSARPATVLNLLCSRIILNPARPPIPVPRTARVVVCAFVAALLLAAVA